MKNLKPVLRIDFPDVDRLGRGKIMLLKHIIDTGSISAAGRAMDMSYRRAWLLVDALNRMFEKPVVESRHGGKQGGGAIVTNFGHELVARYQSMESKIASVLEDDLLWLQRHRALLQKPTSEQ